MSLRTLPIPLIIAVLSACIWPARGLCVEGDSPGDVVRFRRVYAPADQMEDWPRENVRYLPVDPQEFERLVAASGKRTSVGGVSQARWVTAEYRARFDGEGLVDGQASLEVVHLSDHPVLAPLVPCGLAVDNANWKVKAETSKATLGLDAANRLQVVVDRSARLEFQWSLRGRRDASGTVDFRIELPHCPTNRLIVDLPEGMIPLSDVGIVIKGEQIADESVEGGLRRWTIDLGGHNRFRLQAVPAGTPKQRRQLVLLRQSTIYDFSLKGLEVSAQLNLEVHNGSLSQISVELDPQLQLVGALYGEQPVPWLRQPGPNGRSSTLVLNLPEPATGTGRVLRLRALGPLVMDRSWRLPSIRPQKMFWQEGSVTMLVPDSLSVNQIETLGCRQSETGPLSAPRSGQSVQFQCFTPDAGIEIVFGSRRATPRVTSVTEVELGGSGMTGRVAADFSTADGSCFLLSADLDRRWLVDSVQAIPASAMDDWSLGKVNGAKRQLSIRLSKALTPTRPVRIVVTARRLHSPLGRTVGLDELLPLQFVVPGESKRLLAIDVTRPFRLKFDETDQFNRIDPKTLDAAETALLAKPRTHLLVVGSPGAGKLRVSLESRKPSYEGTIRVEAGVGESTLRESYLLRCVPEEVAVDRVLVQFSQRRDSQLLWKLRGDTSEQLTAKRLSIEELVATGLPPAEETWEIRLRRPLDTAFEIHGSREMKSDWPGAVSLASLPEASSQQATLVVRSLGAKAVRIGKCRLKSIPPEIVQPEQCQTALATYRYDPTVDTVAAPEPPLIISVDDKSLTSSAWAWDCRLQSRYEPTGKGRHAVTYRLQNAGCKQMRVTLPGEATIGDVRGVWVNGEPVVWHKFTDKQQQGVQVDLPPERQFPTVSVYFTTSGSRLPAVGSLASPFPSTDLPVLSRHWTAWLPPGFEPLASDLQWQYGRSSRASWSQRLFGLLGRSSHKGPFDPLSADAWAGPLGQHSQRQEAARKVEQLLQLIGTLVETRRQDAGGGEATWARLLNHESLESLHISLLVDHQALDQLGLTPATPLPRAPLLSDSHQGPSDRGAAVLQNANLAMLAGPKAILLTGQTEAVINRADLTPLPRPGTWWVRPGPLAELIRGVVGGNLARDFVAAKTWNRQSGSPKPHWPEATLAGHQPNDTQGWAAGHVEASTTAPVHLRFFHRRTMRLFGSITFLLLVALGWWKAVDRPLLLVSLLGVFGVVALLAPEVYIPIASGAVLATLCCLLLGLIRRRDAATSDTGLGDIVDPDGTRSPPSAVSVAAAASKGILVAAVVLCNSVAFSQEPSSKQPSQETPIIGVFIPVDDQQKPTGGKYQVPAEFYKQLHSRAAASAEKPQGWLLSAATYRGVLSKDTATQRLMVDELKANFDLHIFGRSARVRIPLDRRRSKLLPDGPLLDGILIQPEWEQDGSALLMDVSGPGEYRLELSLRPAILSGGARSGFDLATPRLATSRLELAVPADTPAIEIPSASGFVRRENEPPRLVAELGPSDQLQVRWPDNAAGGAAGPDVEVEELLWINVRPGGVVLDAKFRFKIAAGQLDHLRLLGDQRLRLLPLTGDDPPRVEVRSLPDQSKEFRFKWAQSVSGNVVVHAKFLVTGTSAVGNLRLPELKAADANTTRRCLAVSVDPNLEHEKQVVEGLERLAVPDFVNLWGETALQPEFAYRQVSDQPAWSMATFPRQSHTDVRQELVMSFDRDSAEVRFDAELETTAGVTFQYRLLAPSALEVDHVSVHRGGVEFVQRWARDKRGIVTVFLNGPIDGRQHLSFRGRLPVKLSEPTPLPAVRIQGGRLESSTLELYRRPSVLVEISETVGLDQAEAPLFGSRDTELGRLVSSFRSEGDSPGTATLTISANEPKIEARQITRLRCNGESHSTRVSFRLRPDNGIVDHFVIDVPPDWQGPYRLESSQPATLTVVSTAETKRQLVVRPDEVVTGGYGFSISGPLTVAPGICISVPQITLRQAGHVEQTVVLPTLAGDKPIAWETRGLTPCDLPPGTDTSAATDKPIAYKVVGESFHAMQHHVDPAQRQARVRLADICLNWQSDGVCSGVALFYLVPGRSSQCPLWLPEGYRLVHVKVCGVPISPLPEPNQPNAWLIPLGPVNMPQRVEVVFTGKLPSSSVANRQDLLAPKLGDLAVDKTLWTVASAPRLESLSAADPQSISPWHHELVRLENIAELIESASQAVADNRQETIRWYTCSAARMLAARSALAQRMARAGQTQQTRSDMATVRRLEGEQSQIAARLGLLDVLGQLATGVPSSGDAAESWSSLLDRPEAVFRWAFEGEAPVIVVAYRQVESARLSRRLGSAGMLAAFVLLVGLALHRGLLGELFRHWPHLICVAVGLAWWLWLWPSIFGLVIVAASIASLLRGGWKPSRKPDSQIIRASLETPPGPTPPGPMPPGPMPPGPMPSSDVT